MCANAGRHVADSEINKRASVPLRNLPFCAKIRILYTPLQCKVENTIEEIFTYGFNQQIIVWYPCGPGIVLWTGDVTVSEQYGQYPCHHEAFG